jgi:cytochrome c5
MDAALVRGRMKDADPQIRIQAVRASETLYKAGDRTFAADYKGMAGDRDHDVAIQAMLTLNVLKVPDTPTVVKATMAANQAKGVQLVGTAILDPTANQHVAGARRASAAAAAVHGREQTVIGRGQTIYSEICFSCHGDGGARAAGRGRRHDARRRWPDRPASAVIATMSSARSSPA